MKNQNIETVKRIGTGLTFITFPIMFVFIYAAHPNLLSLSPVTDVNAWIAEFHGNSPLHFGHVLMLSSVPLLLIATLKLKDLSKGRGAWLGFIGGALAVIGAVFLAADKGALCLVTSAFDTLPEDQFAQLLPGLEAMFNKAGWLVLVWLLALLPIGFALQAVGLILARAIPRRQSVLLLIGSVLLANPDIEIISLIASVLLAIALIPLGIQIINGRLETSTAV